MKIAGHTQHALNVKFPLTMMEIQLPATIAKQYLQKQYNGMPPFKSLILNKFLTNSLLIYKLC